MLSILSKNVFVRQEILKQSYLFIILGVIAALGWGLWTWTYYQLVQSRVEEGRHFVTLSKRAFEEQKQFPETLIYAAKAIGFSGFVADPTAQKGHRNFFGRKAEEVAKAKDWIASHHRYRPVWINQWDGPEAAQQLIVGQSGRMLYALGQGHSQRWDFSADSSQSNPYDDATTIAYNPDGTRYAVATADLVLLRATESDDEVARYSGGATCLTFLGDGSALIRLTPEGAIERLVDEQTTLIAQINEPATKLLIGPRDALIAVLSESGKVRLFFTDGTPHPVWNDLDLAEVTALAFHPDPNSDRVSMSFQTGEVSEWRLRDAKKLRDVSNTLLKPLATAYSPDGKSLAIGAHNGNIELWDMDSEQTELKASLSGHHGATEELVFFTDNRLLASAGPKSVRLWDINPSKSGDLDLAAYINEGWYQFDASSGELQSNRGQGFLNLPESSLVASWRSRKSADVPEPIFTPYQSGAPLSPKKNFANSIGCNMIWCKAGTFNMGEVNGPDFAKQHEVKLSNGFWLAKLELSQKNYQSLMATDPSSDPDHAGSHPVENLNWYKAREFCRILTAYEKRKGLLPEGWQYRLPTEAQWEYACRAGSESKFSFGDSVKKLVDRANIGGHKDGFKAVAPVGSFPANPWGFRDMHGNVFEWCRDHMDTANPFYPEGPVTDPLATEGKLRSVRGGAFDALPNECRSAYRDADHPLVPSANLGLRIALTKD